MRDLYPVIHSTQALPRLPPFSIRNTQRFQQPEMMKGNSRVILSGRLERIQRTLARDPVTLDNRLRVNLHVDQPLPFTQQLTRQHANGRRSITDFIVLNFGDVDEDLGRRVVEGDGFEDRRAVVGDRDFTARGGF